MLIIDDKKLFMTNNTNILSFLRKIPFISDVKHFDEIFSNKRENKSLKTVQPTVIRICESSHGT